jgi:DNA-binding response OmpR family regulator
VERLALIIDDEPDVATYLAAVLEDHGWRSRVEHRADPGLAAARAERPDLILLDVMMPERGGLSTLVAIRKDELLADVPVVLVSGIQRQLTWRGGDMLDLARRFRPDAELDKPVAPEELMRVVGEVLARRCEGPRRRQRNGRRVVVTDS